MSERRASDHPSLPPLVSVVMPAYNQGRWIGEAIDSVLAQTYPNLELVIVDDGSTDETAEVLRGYAPRDSRITGVRTENRGASAARNLGAARARGDLIAFCDSDDVQRPGRLAVQAAVLAATPWAAFVASDFSELRGGNVTVERALHHRWLGPTQRPLAALLDESFQRAIPARDLDLPVPPSEQACAVYSGVVPGLFAEVHFAWVGAMMIRRSAFEDAGGFDPALTHYEDWDLGARIGKRHAVAFVDLPLFAYRAHEGQLTRRTRPLLESYLRVIERVFASDPSFLEAHGERVRRALGSAHWQLGRVLLEDGELLAAERAFARSVAANPRQGQAYVDLTRALARLVGRRWARLTAREGGA